MFSKDWNKLKNTSKIKSDPINWLTPSHSAHDVSGDYPVHIFHISILHMNVVVIQVSFLSLVLAHLLISCLSVSGHLVIWSSVDSTGARAIQSIWAGAPTWALTVLISYIYVLRLCSDSILHNTFHDNIKQAARCFISIKSFCSLMR